MDRGPLALFGAVVAVGLGPALWLGAQFGRFDVAPARPPVPVDRTHEDTTQLVGGTAGGEDETGANTPVGTSPRVHVRPVRTTPSATPSSSPSATTSLSASPSATASASPSASPSDPTAPSSSGSASPSTPPSQATDTGPGTGGSGGTANSGGDSSGGGNDSSGNGSNGNGSSGNGSNGGGGNGGAGKGSVADASDGSRGAQAGSQIQS
jgi:uncharacterized membrane protein YgcG